MLATEHTKAVTLLEKDGQFSTQMAMTMGREAEQERGFGGLGKEGLLHGSWAEPRRNSRVWCRGTRIDVRALECASLDEKDGDGGV